MGGGRDGRKEGRKGAKGREGEWKGGGRGELAPRS